MNKIKITVDPGDFDVTVHIGVDKTLRVERLSPGTVPKAFWLNSDTVLTIRETAPYGKIIP